jgi:hypothetical protein
VLLNGAVLCAIQMAQAGETGEHVSVKTPILSTTSTRALRIQGVAMMTRAVGNFTHDIGKEVS